MRGIYGAVRDPVWATIEPKFLSCEGWIDDDAFELRFRLGETVALSQDGKLFAEGTGETTLGHPANAVAWLAGKLAECDFALKAGDLVMTGTLTPITPIAAGSSYVGAFSTLGNVTKTFA